MKKSTHSKIKNTAILFELLTRQVAADTIKGVDKSPALTLIREHFKPNTLLTKELMLYQTLLSEKYSSQDKANYLINTVVKLRNKLNTKALGESKYILIKEIKKHYNLSDFFKTNLNEYKLYASIYRIFEGAIITKAADVVRSRFTLLEHLTKKRSKILNESSSFAEDYIKQDEEVRLLAYKLMIDKFNEKYAGLSLKQRAILKEYINNVSNTVSLKNFLIKEADLLKASIKKYIPTITDKVTKIKLNEVSNMLSSFSKVKTVKEENVLCLLLYHELLKELKNVK